MHPLHILIKKKKRPTLPVRNIELLIELYPAAMSDFLDTFPLNCILKKTPVRVDKRLKQMMANG